MRRLVVAPHMDDESLGCGGLMAKHPDDCTVVVVTDSGEERAREHATRSGHPRACVTASPSA